MNTDARVNFHYPYTVVTPAMALTRAGAGSDYASAFVDSKKQPLDGSKTYKLHIPHMLIKVICHTIPTSLK